MECNLEDIKVFSSSLRGHDNVPTRDDRQYYKSSNIWLFQQFYL